MKRANHVVGSLAIVLLILVSHGLTQHTISIRSGLVRYLQGEVFLDGKPLQLPSEGYQVENGQELSTRAGVGELLLAPNVYLRIKDYSSLRMENNRLDATGVALESGSVLIEITDKELQHPIKILFAGSVVELVKSGVYRFDTTCKEIRIYGGEILVAFKNTEARIKKGRLVRLEREIETLKFDCRFADSLHHWAAQRSFALFNLSRTTRKQEHWRPVVIWSPLDYGWYHNPNFRMKFRSYDLGEATEITRPARENHQHTIPPEELTSPDPCNRIEPAEKLETGSWEHEHT